MINIKSLKNQIPLSIRLFLGKALLFFVVWKIIYGLFLFDSKIIDYPLTTHLGDVSVLVLNKFGPIDGFSTRRITVNSIKEEEVLKTEVSQIYHNDKAVLNIADVCNGLELMVLYIGFILCMPPKFIRQVLYIILGIVILDAVNILRCVGLIYLREYYHVYFEFAHHYLFKITVYAATFLMWFVYSRKIQL
jgi:exosortase/archaeosortase family protein